MRKIASALLGGSIIGLLLTVPGVASAATTPTCGTTNVTSQSQYDGLFSASTANDTRATGHHDLQADGLRIWTESNTSTDKATGYHDLTTPTALAEQHAQSDYVMTSDNTGGGTLPGYQLVIDFKGDGSGYGTLVGEPAAYGDDWWLTNGSSQYAKDGAPNDSGGSGTEWHGTLDEWNASFPSAQIHSFGYSLGSGVQNDVLLHKLTFGCSDYAFALNQAPTAAFTSNQGNDNNCRTFGFNASQSSDPEGSALTYAWKFGDGKAGSGKIVKHTYAAGTHTYSITLTVSDGTNTSSVTHRITACPRKK